MDDLLAPYAEKSFNKYKDELKSTFYKARIHNVSDKFIEDEAIEKTRRDLEQGIQGLEYKLNSVASSRGDYPSK